MEDNPLQEAIAALKAGQRSRARNLLVELLRRDARNEEAWLWLSGAVDKDSDRLICLRQVLAINPDNARARQGVEQLLQRGVTAPDLATIEPVEVAQPSGERPTGPHAYTPPEPPSENVPQAQPLAEVSVPPGEIPVSAPPSATASPLASPEPKPGRVVPARALLVFLIILVIIIVIVVVLLGQRGGL